MTLGQHALEMVLCLLVIAGPTPLALVMASVVARHEDEDKAAKLIAFIATWFVIQACLVLALGWSGMLTPSAVFMGEAALLVVGTALARISKERRLMPAAPDSGRDRLQHVAVGGAIAALGVGLLWQVTTQPISNHDSLAYHLPSMALWYQNHSFIAIQQYPLFSHYPYTWEAVCALFLMPFREDFLVALSNVLAWALFGLSIYRLSILTSATPVAGLSCTALALSFPITALNVNTMHVDLPLAAFFLAGICFSLLWAKLNSPAHLGLALACAGMVAGMKTSGLLYAGLIVVVLAGSRVMLQNRMPKPAVPAAILLIGTACGMFVGGFWYARNWSQIGNPFGFIRMQIGPLSLPGMLSLDHFRATTLWHVFDPWSYADWQILFGQAWQQFGFGLVVLMGLALAVAAAMVQRRPSISRIRLLGLVAFTGAVFALYTLTPYSGDNGIHRGMLHPSIGPSMRYAFPFLGMLTVTAAVGASAVGIPIVALAGLAVAGVALRLFAFEIPYWFALLVAGWLAVGAHDYAPLCYVAHPRRAGGRRYVRPTVVVVALAVIMLASFSARATRDRAESAAYGPVYEFVTSGLAPDEVIGYAECVKSYPLYGKHLERRLVYIPFGPGDRDKWLSYARDNGIDVISIGPAGRKSKAPEMVAWIEGGGLPARRVFGRDLGREPFVYRLDQ